MPRGKTITTAAPVARKRPALKDKSNTAINDRIVSARKDATSKSNKQSEAQGASITLAKRQKRQKRDVDQSIGALPRGAVRPGETRTTRSQQQQVVSRRDDDRTSMMDRDETIYHSSVETPGRRQMSHVPEDETMLSNQDRLVAELLELSPSIDAPATPRDGNNVSEQLDSARHTTFSRSTPAVQHSILALKRFKRRPRQPSMLAMVQQSITKNNTTLLNDHGQSYRDGSVFDFDDIEDDLQPDAASTPLNISKATRSNVGKKSGQLSMTEQDSQSSGRRTRSSRRKRTLDDFSHVNALDSQQESAQNDKVETEGGSRVPASFDNALLTESIGEDLPPDLESNHSSTVPDQLVLTVPRSTSNSIKQVPHAIVNTRDAILETQPERMGSPVSKFDEQDSKSITMDPQSQRSPSPAQQRPATRRIVKAVSTADLRSLLPKRRRRVATNVSTGYNDSNSDDEHDVSGGNVDDEAYTATRSKGMSLKPSATEKRAETTTPLREKDKPDPALAKRTYTRKLRNVDKENTPLPAVSDEITTTMHDALQNSELAEARKKFEEIDEWDMEFETITGEDSRKSSQGWR